MTGVAKCKWKGKVLKTMVEHQNMLGNQNGRSYTKLPTIFIFTNPLYFQCHPATYKLGGVIGIKSHFICDQKLPTKFKGRFYQTVIRW